MLIRFTLASRWRFLFSAFCLLFSACHRGPRTAAELQAQLPHQFRGEIRLQGETQTHPLVIEPHDFNVRNAQLLEFNGVRYQVLTGSQVIAEGDAGIRGTISAPGLEIRVESVTGAGEGAVKADTFEGHLGGGLRTGEAAWTNDLGQRVRLELKAAGP